MDIEELAFKDVKELAYLQDIYLLQIIDFLQKDRKECLNQFTRTHNESVEILQENKQLKDNWNKLKEYISIKLYNTEYLQKLCGCRIDDIDHILLDAIREEIQGLEQESASNE